jgi:hypothetical protein
MAASSSGNDDRSRDWTLNPDPARYGREPMTAARFKKELGELMDAIVAMGTRREDGSWCFALIVALVPN